MEEPQLETVQLYGSRSKRRCTEFAFVLEAVGIRCAVQPRDGKFALVVHARDAESAREQLRLYRHEHRATPPRFDASLSVHDGLVSASLTSTNASSRDAWESPRVVPRRTSMLTRPSRRTFDRFKYRRASTETGIPSPCCTTAS